METVFGEHRRHLLPDPRTAPALLKIATVFNHDYDTLSNPDAVTLYRMSPRRYARGCRLWSLTTAVFDTCYGTDLQWGDTLR